MAGKRGKEIQLQQEIETQEEWEDMLSKEGLCVIDVYQEWCGPTVGMLGTFKRIKNEIGDSLLKFVIAKSDNIDALEKYRGRCQPCFLFFAGGVLVAVVRGANAPLILRTITEQLAQEHKCIDGQAERKEIKDTMIAQLEERERQQEEEEQEEEGGVAKPTVVEAGEAKKEVSVVIIKPDAVQSGKADEIMEEMEKRGIEILRKEERQLTDEEVKNVYIHLQDEEYFEELVTFMTSSPSIVLAITKGKTGENIIQEFRDLIGPTGVEEAKEQAPESLRAKFGSEKYMNAVHGSDSADTAARELAFFFPDFVAPAVAGKVKIQRTLALVRPDAYKNHKDEILGKIRESGFKVAMQKEITLTKEQAEEFYKEHEGQDYFEELTTRMSCGPLLALGLAREDAVAGWRDMLGPTKVEEAKETHPQCLRAQFSEEGAQINMLHGSDSEESAMKEIGYFFPIEQTVAVIKPDAYQTKDEIIEKIHDAGFRIAARKETTLSREIAEEFYADHKDKDYYNDLVEHMVSGPTYFMVLSREGAVDGWRSMIGLTDPSKAKEEDPESLRGLYGQDPLKNALHGSSDPDHAMKQIEKIFGELHFNKDGTVRETKEEGKSSPEPTEAQETQQEGGKSSPEPAQTQEGDVEQTEGEADTEKAQEEQKPADEQQPQAGESQEPEAQTTETTEDKPKSPEPQTEAKADEPAEQQQQQQEQTETKPSEADEPKQEEQVPAEEPKAEEEPQAKEEPKAEEPPKTEEAEKEPETQQEETKPEAEQKPDEATEEKKEEQQEKKEEEEKKPDDEQAKEG